MHESLGEFKFRPDTTTNTRVICPYTSEKLMYNVVNTLAPLYLIGSSSFLQLRKTAIKSWTSLKFDQIGLWTAELYLACNDKKAFFTSADHYRGYHLWSCQNVCDALSFLLDNIYIRFGT